MDKALIEFLAALPTHALLIVAVVYLVSENRRLNAKIDQLHEQSKANGRVLQEQNREIETIKTHVTGETPPRGMPRPKLSDN